MAKRVTSSPPQAPSLSVEQMRRGIVTFNRRIAELEKFDPDTATDTDVETMQNAISEAMDRVFHRGSNDWSRYQGASLLDNGPVSIDIYGRAPQRDTRRYLTEGKLSSLATLRQVVVTLQERIEEAEPYHVSTSQHVEMTKDHRRVFVVHGHDGEPKHDIARFLKALGLDPVILSEQADEGMTIIEKFEKHSDVGFAVILLTPDDQGGVPGQLPRPRARQNVVFELGFFAGKLGRKFVHAIVRGEDLELPSDIHGVIWSQYEGEWKFKLARELKAAGYEIDMNQAV